MPDLFLESKNQSMAISTIPIFLGIKGVYVAMIGIRNGIIFVCWDLDLELMK